MTQPRQAEPSDIVAAGGSRARKLSRWLAPFIPLVILAIEIALFPVFIDTSDPAENVNGNSLIRTARLVHYLGNYKAHRIYVSVDDVFDEDYLPFSSRRSPDGPQTGISKILRLSNTALLSSISPVDDGFGGFDFGRILRKVAALSNDDHDGIVRLVNTAPTSRSILWYDFTKLSSTSTSSVSLPLDHLIILRFESDKRSVSTNEIREVLETAREKHLSTLVLPCLSSSPQFSSDPTPLCASTYKSVFETLEPGGLPYIFFTLDKNWSTEAIKRSVDLIKQAWKERIAHKDQHSGPVPTLYHADVRLLLLFLSFCLLVCSFRIDLTPRSYSAVCIVFVATGLEIQERLAPLLSGLAETTPDWVFKCALLAILSAGFLFFIDLDMEHLLRGSHGGTR